MTVQAGLCRTWSESLKTCFSCRGSYGITFLKPRPVADATRDSIQDKTIKKTGIDTHHSEGPVTSTSLTEIDVVAMANNMAKVGITETEDETLNTDMKLGETSVKEHTENMKDIVADGMNLSDERNKPKVKCKNAQQVHKGSVERRENKMVQKTTRSVKNSENADSLKGKNKAAEKISMKNNHAKKISDDKNKSLDKGKEDSKKKEGTVGDLKLIIRRNKSKYTVEDKAKSANACGEKNVVMIGANSIKVTSTRNEKADDKSNPNRNTAVENKKIRFSKSETCSTEMKSEDRKANVTKRPFAKISKNHKIERNTRKSELQPESDKRFIGVDDSAAGDKVTTTDKAIGDTIKTVMYSEMISTVKGSKIKKDNKNNNGNEERTTSTENDKSGVMKEKDDKVEISQKPVLNSRVEGDRVCTVKKILQRSGSFDFKSYLEVSYTKDGSTNKPKEEEPPISQISKKTPTQKLYASHYINLRPFATQRRPNTAELYDPKIESGESKGNRYQCKSASTRVGPNISTNSDYYTVPRSKYFPKRTQVNSATVLSSTIRQNKKQKTETLFTKTGTKPIDERSNKMNVYLCGKAIESPRDKSTEDPVASGDKTVKESSSVDANEKWFEKETFRMKKVVEKQHIDDDIVTETNEQMERLGKLETKKNYVVTSQTLDKIKDLKVQYGQQKKMKEKPIVEEKGTDDEVCEAISETDIDRSDIDAIVKQVVGKKKSDSAIVPCESQHTYIEATPVADSEPILNDIAATHIEAPSYGSSSSCAPDMYDIYARKPVPKSVIVSPVKKPLLSPNCQIVNAKSVLKALVEEESKTLVNMKTRVKPDTQEETYLLKYTHASSADQESDEPPVTSDEPYVTSADKVFKELLGLCKDNSDTAVNKKTTDQSSQSTEKRTCHDCVLCQATAISSGDKDMILNQLAFHVIERMKNLNMKTEENEGEAETKSNIHNYGLLDKLNLFGTDTFAKDNKMDNVIDVDEHRDHDEVSKKECDKILKVKSLFEPVDQPVFTKVSKQEPSPDSEENTFSSMMESDKMFLVPLQMQGKEIKIQRKVEIPNEPVIVIPKEPVIVNPKEPVIVPQMEIENLNPVKEDLYKSQEEFESMNFKAFLEKKRSAKQLNVDCTFDETSDKRSVSARAYTKNVRPKSSRKMFCPMSVRKSIVDEQKEKNSAKPSVSCDKYALKEKDKSEASHWQSSRYPFRDNHLKFMPEAKPETKKGKKYIDIQMNKIGSKESFKAKGGETPGIAETVDFFSGDVTLKYLSQNMSETKKPMNKSSTRVGHKENIKHLVGSDDVPLRQLSSAGSACKKNEEIDGQSKKILRNRTAKTASVAPSDTQNQTRSGKYKEKQKGNMNEMFDSISSAVESAIRQVTPVTGNQRRLRAFLKSQIKKKRNAALKKKVDPAPSQESSQPNNQYSAKLDRNINTNTISLPAEIESDKMDERKCKDKSKSFEVEEKSTSFDSNLNNNTNKEKDGRQTKTAHSIVPPHVDHIYEAEHIENSDSNNDEIKIELDVDEVIDWEFSSPDSTRVLDEITYTITHADGTQIIVSNKHPDFENIVKFIEDKKRIHGEDSITIEAELSLNQEKEGVSCVLGNNDPQNLSSSTSDVTPNWRNVIESSSESFKNAEPDIMLCKSERNDCPPINELDNNKSDTEGNSRNSPEDTDIKQGTSITPKQINRDSDKFAIFKTLSGLVPKDMITKCFTEEDSSDTSDYKGTSLLTGKECKHHDNIFEAFYPNTYNAERGDNVRNSTDDDSAIADIWSSDSQETVTEHDLGNQEDSEPLPSASSSSSIRSEGFEFENVLRGENPVASEEKAELLLYGNDMVFEHGRKGMNILQEDCVTNQDLLDRKTNIVFANADVQQGQEIRIGIESKRSQLYLSEENKNFPFLEETEIYEMLRVPEYSSDGRAVLVEESGSKIGISANKPQREELKDYVDHESGQNNILPSDVENIDGRAKVKEEKNNPVDVGPDPSEEGSFSDFEETLYDQGDILPSYKDNHNDEEFEETSKISTATSRKKKKGKQIRKSAQEVLDKLERCIEKSITESENQATIEIKETLDRNNEKNSDSEQENYYSINENSDSKKIDDKKYNSIGSPHARKKNRGRKKSTKMASSEEVYEEEEELRKKKEEQIAMEGFIKTQQKYMQIVLNNSMEAQRGKGEALDNPDGADIQSRYMVGF